MLKLPELVLFDDHGNDWETYENVLYDFFKNDFIDTQPVYRNSRVGIMKQPLYKGKEYTFWHITSTGEIETKRVPDFRKCERIRWPNPILNNCEKLKFRSWENKRGKNKNICICYGDWEYLIILIIKKGYNLLLTAYPIEEEHGKRKLEKEYNQYIANIAPV